MFLSNILYTLIPTLFIAVIVLLSILFGIWRGFRKSLILAIQALILFTFCVICYFQIVNNASTDTTVVTLANKILGANKLQSMLGASSSATSLTDIITEVIVNKMDMGSGLALILEDNGAYLITIVNLIYHIVFLFAFYLIYLLLVFFVYIIYLIFYPQRRHVKHFYRDNEKTNPDAKYKKRRLLGGLIGGLRGFVYSIIILSLVGSFLYIGGGNGDKEYESYDWGDSDLNTYYSVYQELGSYANSGIYKVLNNLKDKDDVPYYLYAANLVLKGSDTSGNTNTNLVLSKDLGVLTNFGRDTLDLLVKYGKEDLKTAVLEKKNNTDGKTNYILNAVGEIFQKEEFQKEFENLIDNFTDNTFFINMAFSFVDSFASHITELNLSSSLSEDNAELLNVLFNSSYASSYIPEDKTNLDTKGYVSTLKPSMLMNKDDAKILFRILFAYLSISDSDDQVTSYVDLASTAIDEMEGLSLLQDENKDTFNPVFERLYTYLSNRYVSDTTDNSESELTLTYLLDNNNSNNVDWIEELKSLLKTAKSSLQLFKNGYAADSEKGTTTLVIEGLYKVFDSSSESYNENQANYNNIVDGLSSSKLLGKVLSTTFISDKMLEVISNITSGSDVYIPTTINYNNTTDSSGNVVYGEVYNLLKGVEALFKHQETKSFVLSLVENGTDNLDNSALSDFCDSLLDNDNEVLNYLFKSKVVTSVISGVAFGLKIDSIGIVFPDSSKVKIDGEVVNLLSSSELKKLVQLIPDLFDAVDDEDSTKAILSFVIDSKSKITESNILCATVANYFINSLPENLSSELVIPDDLKNNDLSKLDCESTDANASLWVNEIKVILDVFSDVLNIKDVDFNNSDALKDTLLDVVTKLNDTYTNTNYSSVSSKLDLMYESGIMKSTLAKQLDNNLGDDIVSNSVKDSLKTDGIYNKAEVKALINTLVDLDINLDSSDMAGDIKGKVKTLNDTSSVNETQTKLDIMYESVIIKNALAKQLDGSLDGVVSSDVIASVKTDDIYNKAEVSALINTLVDLDINLDSSDMAGDIKGKVKTLNDTSSVNETQTKLDIMYESVIIKNALAKQLDGSLDGVVSSDVIASVKTDDIYNKAEVSALINTLVDLDINLDSTDMAGDIKGKVKTLNDISTVNKTQTKLDIMYESVIIKNALATQLDDSLTSEVLSNANRDKAKTDGIYKIAEIKALINVLNDLNVDLEGDISSQIKNQVDSLNNNSTIDTSKTKLDIMYESSIIKYALATQLDNNLGTDIVSSDVKESTKTDGIYNQSEVAALIDTLNVLNIKFTSNNIAGDIKNQVTSLNQYIENSTTKTKLDVMYESTIIKSALAKQLDDNLGNDIVSDDTKSSVKTSGVYLKSEVAALINSINELGVDFNDTSNMSSTIMNSVSVLNDTSTVNKTQTKLELMYESVIIKCAIAKQITGEESLIIPSEALQKEKLNSYNIEYVLLSEMQSLVSLVSDYESDIKDNTGSIDYSLLKDAIRIKPSDFAEEGTFIKSKILHATVSKYITEALNTETKTIILDESFITSAKVYIKQIELQSLITLACLSSNSEDVGVNVEFNTDSAINVTKINSVIANSLIVRRFITDSIISNIDNTEVFETSYPKTSNTPVLTSTELQALINALAVNSTTTDTDGSKMVKVNADIDINSYEISKSDLETLRNSLVISYKLTKSIEDMKICGTNKLPEAAYDNDSYITLTELESVFDLVATSGKLQISAISGGNYTTIDDTKLDAYKNSSIVRFKISEQLIKSSAIVVSKELYSKDANSFDMIEITEYSNLIDGLVALKFTDTTNITVAIDENVTDNDASTAAKSIILRATITAKISTSSDGVKIYYLATDLAVNTYSNIVLSETEITNLIIGIRTMGITGGVDVEISTDKIKELATTQSSSGTSNLDVVLNSNTLRYIMSQVIDNNNGSYLNPTSEESVYLHDGTITSSTSPSNVKFYSSTEIKSYATVS